MSDSTLLTDDHLDLIVTAARQWRVLIPRAMAAFLQSPLHEHFVVAAAGEAGRLLRAENLAALTRLSDQGRTKPADRLTPARYEFRPVDHLDPVEVIKAAQAATAACQDSPTWTTSPARRILDAVIQAATLRLDGYAEAPWWWTRPQRRSGIPVGVALGDDHPEVPGLVWVTPDAVSQYWDTAAVVITTVAAVTDFPSDLKARAGVFVLVRDEAPDAVWNAVVALDMQALVTYWPACQPWLLEQLRAPSAEFNEFRSR